VREQLTRAEARLSRGRCRVLDYGCGFAITAGWLAERHEVTGIEPDERMIASRMDGGATAIAAGGIDELRRLDSGSFDLVLCHNVFEYDPERRASFDELVRVTKPGGALSIVKHEKAGKICSLATYFESPMEALAMFEGSLAVESDKFGAIQYYDIGELCGFREGLRVEGEFGIRAFYGNVHRNEVKYEPEWQEAAFRLEMAVCETPPYRDIAFWKHYALRKLP
jgi:SAM-dependent methyltransferase